MFKQQVLRHTVTASQQQVYKFIGSRDVNFEFLLKDNCSSSFEIRNKNLEYFCRYKIYALVRSKDSSGGVFCLSDSIVAFVLEKPTLSLEHPLFNSVRVFEPALFDDKLLVKAERHVYLSCSLVPLKVSIISTAPLPSYNVTLSFNKCIYEKLHSNSMNALVPGKLLNKICVDTKNFTVSQESIIEYLLPANEYSVFNCKLVYIVYEAELVLSSSKSKCMVPIIVVSHYVHSLLTKKEEIRDEIVDQAKFETKSFEQFLDDALEISNEIQNDPFEFIDYEKEPDIEVFDFPSATPSTTMLTPVSESYDQAPSDQTSPPVSLNFDKKEMIKGELEELYALISEKVQNVDLSGKRSYEILKRENELRKIKSVGLVYPHEVPMNDECVPELPQRTVSLQRRAHIRRSKSQRSQSEIEA